MFPMLTKPFPAEQSPALERLPVDCFGSGGGARHRELAARERLPGAPQALAQRVVAEEAVEGAGPGARIERGDEHSRLTRIHQPGVAPAAGADHGAPEG